MDTSKLCFKAVYNKKLDDEDYYESVGTCSDDRIIKYEVGKHVVPVVPGTPIFTCKKEEHTLRWQDDTDPRFLVLVCEYDELFLSEGREPMMMGVVNFDYGITTEQLSEFWKAERKEHNPELFGFHPVEGTLLVTGLTVLMTLEEWKKQNG